MPSTLLEIVSRHDFGTGTYSGLQFESSCGQGFGVSVNKVGVSNNQASLAEYRVGRSLSLLSLNVGGLESSIGQRQPVVELNLAHPLFFSLPRHIGQVSS